MPISVGIVGYEVPQHERVAALITAVGGPVRAAALMTKTRQHIDNMRKPEARLSLEDLLPLCIEAGVSLDWVATGHQVRPDLAQEGEAQGQTELQQLRGPFVFRVATEWLQGVPPQHARWARLEDAGMAPLMAHKGMVIVDTRPAPLKAGAYLIDLDGELVARRLNQLPDSKFELVAEGEASWRYRFGNADRPKVLHRIVWHSQAA